MARRLINRRPGRVGAVLLGALPFVVLAAVYLSASRARLAANPDDRLLPAPGQFLDAIVRMAFEPSRRTGEYLLWTDTLASLERIGLGVSVAAVTALCIGILTGLLPYARAGLSPVVKAFSLIPPLSVLPILFITFGLGEAAKVMLIVFGITPFMTRDLQQRTLEIPEEQLIKAQTLGASSGQILLRVALPQILPRLIESVRLGLGPAWLFLIAAEAIAAEEGLGYRIFLLRRYLAMDVILPYVAWITLIAFSADTLLRLLRRRAFPWTAASA
ncbi:ABC transporter permease [Sediminicurvatus halobius]|uniref:Lipid kinase n=1 Tax=Sediminicurvatus halobius TaxID=2182432 RepID=A0A2U2N9U4_9GAMM|nr:ABC transporter permease subunit [Spiribacter halobius]PWG65719.1 lipid kinase [Spiribacter halobius]UEX77753.1 ABC transporter permease subunit [Spiribacter halobius]